MKMLFFVLIGLLAITLIVSGCGKTAGKAVQVAPGSQLSLVCNDPKNMDKCLYTISCPDGTYATGITGGAGMILDSIRLACITDASLTSKYYGKSYSAVAGGNGGGYYSTECNDYLTGISTYISKFKGTYYPSQLSPICEGLVNKSIVIGWGKDGLRGPWTIACPAGQVVTSITGQAGVVNTTGSYVYSIKSVGCKTKPVTTPTTPGIPEDMNKIPQEVIKGEDFLQKCVKSGLAGVECSKIKCIDTKSKFTDITKVFNDTYYTTEYCLNSTSYIRLACKLTDNIDEFTLKRLECSNLFGAGTLCIDNQYPISKCK